MDLFLICTIVCAILICLILYKFILFVEHFFIYRRKVSTIPSPYKGFYGTIRCIQDLLTLNIHNMGDTFGNYCLQFHKEGLTMLRYPKRPLLLLYKPHFLEAFVNNSQITDKGLVYKMAYPVVGEGLVTSTGTKWYLDRKLISPWFNHSKIASIYNKVVLEKCAIFVECLENKINAAPNKKVDVYEDVKRCSYDIICRAAMGIDEDTLRNGSTVLIKSVMSTLSLLVNRFVFKPWLDQDFLYYITSEGREFKKSAKILRNYTKKIVECRQKARQESGAENIDDSEEFEEKYFLDFMLDSMKSERFSLEQICDHVITLIAAGFDTISTAALFCLFALGNNPNIQEKVHQEIQEVFSDNNEPQSLNNINKMTYFDRVIKESLRYYPSVPRVNREVLEEFILDGKYIVPKGTNILVEIWSMHHNPDVWEDPETFDPNRFLPENFGKQHRYSFIPFSAGIRNCAGMKLAMMETKMIVLSVLRKWRIKSVKSTEDMKLLRHFVTEPADYAIELFFTAK